MLPEDACHLNNESESEPLFHVSRWLMILGGLIMLITLLALQQTNDWDVQGYIVFSLLHGLVYLFAVWKLFRSRSRPGNCTWILIWALAFRALAMLAEPALTTDAFRYVWDGKVQIEGVNPYLYVPADPQLESLRDDDIYPHINKKDVAHTIYPPAAQVFFLLGASFGLGLEGMKIMGLICECITIGALLSWLRVKKLPATWVLIYAWHPLPIWEFASQAHVDCAATALIVLAILAAQKRLSGLGWSRIINSRVGQVFSARHFSCDLETLGLADAGRHGRLCGVILSSLLDHSRRVVAWFSFPALGRRRLPRRLGLPSDLVSRLLGLGTVSGRVYLTGILAVLGVLGLQAFFKREPAEIQPKMLVALGAMFVFLSTPHYPWYFGFLIALSVMHLSVPVLVMTVLCSVLQVTRSDGGFSWTEPFALTYLVPLGHLDRDGDQRKIAARVESRVMFGDRRSCFNN